MKNGNESTKKTATFLVTLTLACMLVIAPVSVFAGTTNSQDSSCTTGTRTTNSVANNIVTDHTGFKSCSTGASVNSTNADSTVADRTVVKSGTCTNNSGDTNTSTNETCSTNSCDTNTSNNKTYTNGTCTNGTCSNGTCSNGTCSNGTCSDGTCSNGTCSDGTCSNGTCSNGTCSDGTCSNGTCDASSCTSGNCTTGTCANSTGSTGTCANGTCNANMTDTDELSTSSNSDLFSLLQNYLNNCFQFSGNSQRTTYSDNQKEAVKDESSSNLTYQDSNFELTDEYAAEVIALVNEERVNAGLNEFTVDESLCDAAAIRAPEIQTTFSHTRPDGSSCFTALAEVNAQYTSAGENIAIGQTSPQAVVQAWMNSPGHRANILNANFTRIGVASLANSGGNYGGYAWVQEFAN